MSSSDDEKGGVQLGFTPRFNALSDDRLSCLKKSRGLGAGPQIKRRPRSSLFSWPESGKPQVAAWG